MLSWCEVHPLAEAIAVACIQAEAAIEASRIQAAVSRDVGVWQGQATIVAGALTLVAGALAIGAAIIGGKYALRSAARQVQAIEQQHADKVAAYRLFVRSVLDETYPLIAAIAQSAEMQLARWQEGGGPYPLGLPAGPIDCDDFKAAHWEQHALLGGAFVYAAVTYASCISDLNSFWREMSGKTTDDYSESPLPGEMERGDNGEMYVLMMNAVQHFHAVATEALHAAVDMTRTIGLPDAQYRNRPFPLEPTVSIGGSPASRSDTPAKSSGQGRGAAP